MNAALTSAPSNGIPAGFVGIISREKLTGGGRHAGVMLPGGCVIDFSPRGVRVCTLVEFLEGHSGRTEREVPASAYRQMLWRAQTVPHSVPAYDLVTYNCEHFANYIAGAPAESGQINALTFLGLLGVLWYALQ